MSRLRLARLFVGLPLVSGAAFMSGVARAEPTKQECVAANESAQDLRLSGKLRAARKQLTACEAPSCPALLRQDCVSRLNEIDRAIPTVVFEVKDGANNELTSVKVSMDGEPLLDRLDGRATAVDPGEHVFRFEAAGAPPLSKTIVIHEGERDRRIVTSLGAPSDPSAAAAEAPKPMEVPRDETGRTQRLTGLIVGAVGVAGVVTGAILGLVAKGTYDRALKECPDGPNAPEGCGQAGHDGGQTASGQATASTIAFIAGGAFAAAGIVLYVAAPHAQRTATAFSIQVAGPGVRLGGQW